MGESVGIDQFLIGRPLLLELLERGLIGDRALGIGSAPNALREALRVIGSRF
jgi:hypothetical protein